MRVLDEEGQAAPMTVTVLEALCRALGVSMTRILTDAENSLARAAEAAVADLDGASTV